ncbi:cobyrinate a,c-diamide synthase [Anaerotruncus colihominis]|uniref:cobyrinate a,c-diamide synthase n=1 Tax=Anaerotruncus colihominis TaxID=169435 RepID=UPI003513667B
MTIKPLARFLLAAASSGSGKTTMTCAILRAWLKSGEAVASFKCGPDYIDPMFHRKSVGTIYSANLDLFLSDEDTVRRNLARSADLAQLAVIEGVMGYYDGVAFTDEASSCALARATATPAVLIVDCRGMALSSAALVKGFVTFQSNSQIHGVLLNRCPPPVYSGIKGEIEQTCGVPVFGYLPPMKDCMFESRHLGLVTAEETRDLQQKLDMLAAQAEQTIDLAALAALARSAPPLVFKPLEAAFSSDAPMIAVARDAAFCFYYEESLALLQEMGARLISFSPLKDEAIPKGCSGLLLGGGYPELYAKRLSENTAMRAAIRHAVENGMPLIAECGGFLYLHRALEGMDGEQYPMAGVIDADAFQTSRPVRFGYAALTARRDNMLCHTGETLRVHSFHYWDSTDIGAAFTAQKPHRDLRWNCVHAGPSVYAGFPHLYLAGNPSAAARFLEAARAYHERGALI